MLHVEISKLVIGKWLKRQYVSRSAVGRSGAAGTRVV